MQILKSGTAVLLAVAMLMIMMTSSRWAESAQAEDDASPPTLGPASKVLLENAEAETITLSVNNERVSWGDTAQKRIYSQAYVHIGKALQALLQGASYREEQERLGEELRDTQQAIGEAFAALQERMQEVGPEDPEAEEINQQAQQLMQQRDRFIQQASAAQSTLQAEQVERVYRELVDAVNVVADRMGIDTVHRFIPTDDAFEIQPGPQAFQNAMLQIRLRSVLRYPTQIDITDEVMEELGIE